MKIYISTELEKVLLESEYEDLLKKESKEYGKTIEELRECDTDYRGFEISLEVNDETTLLKAIESVAADIETTEDILQDIDVYDFLEAQNFSHYLIGCEYLTVHFEEIGPVEGKLDAEIKITKIELT